MARGFICDIGGLIEGSESNWADSKKVTNEKDIRVSFREGRGSKKAVYS